MLRKSSTLTATFAFAAAGWTLAGALAAAPPDLGDDATYRTWRDKLLPSAQEDAWRRIAWRPTFWDAVREARQQDRPVLVWLINGPGLGRC
uniref:DUF255 domain-containing protein n=1 Tax=uncultured Armatimonadetes bacterium TaxID=157466 RepID=A0A6J4IZX5_9BACT|nr:hypothetical protein AVDCRST_MAG63-2582 [uncultured Armatimonadetes bacterium]